MKSTMRILSGLLVTLATSSPLSARDAPTPVADNPPTVDIAEGVSRTGSLNFSIDNSIPDAMSKSVSVTISPETGASVSGVADVIGFPSIDSGSWGNIDWKVDGSSVTGVLSNRDGTVEGVFEGTISPTGVSGKVTHRDGRVGLWSWKGPPPK